MRRVYLPLWLPARAVGIIIPLALLLIALGHVTGCASKPEAPREVINISKDAPENESWRTTILFTDSARTKARLVVGHARKYASKMITLLDSGVYVEFYDIDGSISATLIADSARVDDRTKDMVAYGAVHVQSDRNKTTVDTDELNWSNDRRLLHSDAHVKIVDGMRGRTLEGKGFESDEGLK
ncbi:MAG: LPS export ABC transporter periplasmic protein LptC, partial [Bacteroidota bacterium]